MAALTHEDDSGVKSSIIDTQDLRDEPLMMVKHEEDLDLHGHEERYDLEISICTHSFHHVDHESHLLENPMKA